MPCGNTLAAPVEALHLVSGAGQSFSTRITWPRPWSAFVSSLDGSPADDHASGRVARPRPSRAAVRGPRDDRFRAPVGTVA